MVRITVVVAAAVANWARASRVIGEDDEIGGGLPGHTNRKGGGEAADVAACWQWNWRGKRSKRAGEQTGSMHSNWL